MSSLPLDRYSNFRDHTDSVGIENRQTQDQLSVVRSGEITWSDFQRALWAPPSVRQGSSSESNPFKQAQEQTRAGQQEPAPHAGDLKTAGGELQPPGQTLTIPQIDFWKGTTRELPQVEPAQLNKPQENLEQAVRSALSLHVLSLEEKKPASQKFPHLPVLDAFHSPDCKLSHSFLPDGTATTIQTAPDGSTRTQVRTADGGKEAKVADRYGRPVLTEKLSKDGSWTICEMTYSDAPGKISPFVSGKRVTQSDGSIVETDFSWHGKVTRRQEYNLKQ